MCDNTRVNLVRWSTSSAACDYGAIISYDEKAAQRPISRCNLCSQ